MNQHTSIHKLESFAYGFARVLQRYVCICVHMVAYVCIWLHMVAYVCICVHMGTYVCICANVQMCAYVQICAYGLSQAL